MAVWLCSCENKGTLSAQMWAWRQAFRDFLFAWSCPLLNFLGMSLGHSWLKRGFGFLLWCLTGASVSGKGPWQGGRRIGLVTSLAVSAGSMDSPEGPWVTGANLALPGPCMPRAKTVLGHEFWIQELWLRAEGTVVSGNGFPEVLRRSGRGSSPGLGPRCCLHLWGWPPELGGQGVVSCE